MRVICSAKVRDYTPTAFIFGRSEGALKPSHAYRGHPFRADGVRCLFDALGARGAVVGLDLFALADLFNDLDQDGEVVGRLGCGGRVGHLDGRKMMPFAPATVSGGYSAASISAIAPAME